MSSTANDSGSVASSEDARIWMEVKLSKTVKNAFQVEIAQWPSVDRFLSPDSDVGEARDSLSELLTGRKSKLKTAIEAIPVDDSSADTVEAVEEMVKTSHQELAYLYNQLGDRGDPVQVCIQWPSQAKSFVHTEVPYRTETMSLYNDFLAALPPVEESSDDD